MRFILSITRAALGVLMAVAVLAGVVGGCYWLSLVASLNGLEAGIRERDVVKLDKYIDWARVREQVRSDLHAFVMTQVFKEAKGGEEKGLAFSIGTLLAGAVAPAMIDRVVDGFVTPQALVRLLAEKPPSEQPDLTFDREGFTDLDEYTLLLGASGPTRPRIRAILRRDGITWRVVRVVFPPGEAPWEINATWPVAARLYALGGLSPRLELRKVVPTRTASSLVIEGDVTNSGNMASDVPQLRVVLHTAAEKEVQFKIIDPPKARLGPSETARFKTTFDHPDEAATGVVVTFFGRGTSLDDTGSPAPQLPEPTKMPTLSRNTLKPETGAPGAQIVGNEPNPEEQNNDPSQFDPLLSRAQQSPAPASGVPTHPEQTQPTAAPTPTQPAPAAVAAPQTAYAPTPVPVPVPSNEVSPGYRALLSAWLESHKRYPDSARQRGEEGRAVLRFAVDRSGRVLDFAVTQSSGYPDLDSSIEQMMRGALLPPFPASMTQSRIDVSVTIRFSLDASRHSHRAARR